MSYCRTSGLSDVYIFSSGTALECYIANDEAKRGMVHPDYLVNYKEFGELGALKAMLGHCHYLIDQGVRVPGYAMRRMMNEIVELESDRFFEWENQQEADNGN